LTEFLPISSTGHLIVAGSLLGYTGEQAKVFEIVIQAGAILAVCWEFRARLVSTVAGLGRDPVAQRFVANLVIAFIPAAVLGLLFAKAIKRYLFAPLPVAMAFIVGALVILWVERRRRSGTSTARIDDVDDMRWTDALKVGCAQAFALIPGTSRSGATIIGGMLFGLSREAATRFSFFLAIPTLLAACAYDFLKNRALFSAHDLQGLGIGFVASFIAAFLCVRGLIRYVSRHDFTPFAWYRIAFGLLILATAWSGIVDWT
ncbi:MAG TPA: undecaprenyl-diphosphate phosphatase, partial [Rhodanobacteraceae bacterium]